MPSQKKRSSSKSSKAPEIAAAAQPAVSEIQAIVGELRAYVPRLRRAIKALADAAQKGELIGLDSSANPWSIESWMVEALIREEADNSFGDLIAAIDELAKDSDPKAARKRLLEYLDSDRQEHEENLALDAAQALLEKVAGKNPTWQLGRAQRALRALQGA